MSTELDTNIIEAIETVKPSKPNKNKGKRIIPIDQALKIMSDYKKNNFNAYKTLVQNGYSPNYANDNSKYVIEASKERIEQQLQIPTQSKHEISEVASTLYASIGITREKVLEEYLSILMQNVNLPVKLRALEPLLRNEGINWEDKQQDTAPQVVIKVNEVNVKQEDNQTTTE